MIARIEALERELRDSGRPSRPADDAASAIVAAGATSAAVTARALDADRAGVSTGASSPPPSAAVTARALAANRAGVSTGALSPSPHHDYDDAASETASHLSFGTNEAVESRLAFYRSSDEEKLRQIPPEQRELVSQVLNAKADNTGLEWKSRHYTNDGVAVKWARVTDRNQSTTDRNASVNLKLVGEFRFARELKAQDVTAQSQQWNRSRPMLIGLIRECLTSGCEFDNVLRKLLAAAAHEQTGNQRVFDYVKRALTPPSEGFVSLNDVFPPLAADCLIYDLDLSYRSHAFGNDAPEADWDACVRRELGDDAVTLANRCVMSYLRQIGHSSSAFNSSNVWSHATHVRAINTRFSMCLENDAVNPTRGLHNAWLFRSTWEKALRQYNLGKIPASELSCVVIADTIIRPEEAVGPDKSIHPVQHAPSAPAPTPAPPIAPPTSPPITPPQPLGGGRGGRRAAAAAAVIAAADAVAAAHYGSGKGGGAPSAPPTGKGRGGPPGKGSHVQEPPPTDVTASFLPPKSSGVRWCEPPANGAGKPKQLPSGDWDEQQWKSVAVDWGTLDALSTHDLTKAACILARPNESDLKTYRVQGSNWPKPVMPRADGEAKYWASDACTYCHFRDRAPAGTPAAELWWYGNGDGAHNPSRCQPFKRYLAEGGDTALHPASAELLRTCLRCLDRRA